MGNWKDTIKKQYDAQLKAQAKQLESGYGQNRQNYGRQLADAGEQYQELRDRAYVDHAMAEQTRKENMANMGLSGAGGIAQTLQQRSRTALLNAVGDADRKQQDYTDNIRMALNNLTAQYNADLYSAQQQNAADQLAALRAADQWQSQYDLSKKQFDLSQKNSAFDRAWALYKKRRITKKQFEQMTGYRLR